jgi:hypothetical protein
VRGGIREGETNITFFSIYHVEQVSAWGNHVEEFSEGADSEPLRGFATPWRLRLKMEFSSFGPNTSCSYTLIVV